MFQFLSLAREALSSNRTFANFSVHIFLYCFFTPHPHFDIFDFALFGNVHVIQKLLFKTAILPPALTHLLCSFFRRKSKRIASRQQSCKSSARDSAVESYTSLEQSDSAGSDLEQLDENMEHTNGNIGGSSIRKSLILDKRRMGGSKRRREIKVRVTRYFFIIFTSIQTTCWGKGQGPKT